jgi:hypothetical protein
VDGLFFRPSKRVGPEKRPGLGEIQRKQHRAALRPSKDEARRIAANIAMQNAPEPHFTGRKSLL